MRRWAIVAAVALLVVLAGAAAVLLLGHETPPNVLIVVVDDIGTDKIGAYGEHPVTPRTPTIDGLAAEGVLFRNAYAYPLCSPTRAALLTGRYGRRNGIGMVLRADSTWELPLDEVTIPELLKQGAGYATAAVGKWHLSGEATRNAYRHPNLQGFDSFAGTIHQLYTAAEGGPPSDYFSYDKDVDGVVTRVREYATTGTTDDALAAASRMSEPWMLYVAYSAAHAPFHVPPGSDLPPDAPVVDRYHAMVEKMDEELGRLLAGLPADVRARTLIVFVGDNGTEPQAVLPPRDPEASKGTLAEGGVNVPFIVSGPGVRHGVAEALVHVVDVLPTVAEVAGVDATRTGKELDGVSFASVLRDPGSKGQRRFVYLERFQPVGRPPWKNDWQGIRDDRYKVVIEPGKAPALHDLEGIDDDGPPIVQGAMSPEERERYQRQMDELGRIAGEVRFEY